MNQVLSFRSKLSVARCYFRRSSKLLMRFKVSLGISFIAMFVQIAIFYFINSFVGGVTGYGNYFTFVIVGLAVNQFMQTTLTTYLQTMHSIYWSNWLEILLTSPTGTTTFFTSVMIWNYLMVTINVAFYFVVGIFVFGASFILSGSSWVIIPILLLLIISLSGFGLISASMFMLINAKGNIEPVGWGIATLSGLIAGVYFPPEYLPSSVQILSKFIPQTYAIDAIRRILLQGENLSSHTIQLSIGYLVVFSIILFPLGMWLFNRGIKKAERDGSLARWV